MQTILNLQTSLLWKFCDDTDEGFLSVYWVVLDNISTAYEKLRHLFPAPKAWSEG